MILWVFSGWLMGLLGSLHCIGMCGPLAISLPIAHQSTSNRLLSTLYYNIGRIFTYSMFGALLGVTKEVIVPFVFQPWLSSLLGLVFIVGSILFIFSKQKLLRLPSLPYQTYLIHKIGLLYTNPTHSRLFFIGTLNGLLPCGLVYAALAAAFTANTMLLSILFMAFFGLGTLPLMWGISFFAHLVTPTIRHKIQFVYPYLYLLVGVLLMYRGFAEYEPVQAFLEKKGIHCY
jgi:sulfite exporter TauE/SafE